MSAQENVETVKANYEAFGRGDVQAILDRCTDDVDWASEAADDAAPWHGERHGKDEVAGFFAGIAEASSVRHFETKSFTSNDNDEVMVLVDYGMTASATGRDVDMQLPPYWQLRDGKVCRYRGTEDTALVAEAMAV